MDRIKAPKKPRPPRCVCASTLHWALGIVSPSALYSAKGEKVRKYRMELVKYDDVMVDYKIEKRSANRDDWDYKRRKKWRENQGMRQEYNGESIGEIAYAGFMEGLKEGLKVEDGNP